ncbi:MAG: hypothetical protein QOF14_5649 [Hyphomicrobiales bacterium]|jgi:hypothetical protein|nr:hypothetical protein [Hyphomicrobiales bacterium]
MPRMKDMAILEKDDGTETDIIVNTVDRIQVLGTNGSRTKVKLIAAQGAPEGWVSSDAVDVTDAPPSGPIPKVVFARVCWRQALYFGVNAHYLAAVAELRSKTAEGKDGEKIGPYRFTAAEWAAAIAGDEFKEIIKEGDQPTPIYQPDDIFNWRRQCAVFGSQASQALDKFGDKTPTVIELYISQLSAPPADDTARKQLSNDLKAALDITREPVRQAGMDVLDNPDDNKETLKDEKDPAKPMSSKLTDGTFREIAPRLMTRLMKDFDLTDVQAAGILGNIGHECAGFKLMQEVKPLGGGRGGLGMCQWTGPRRRQFEQFLSDHKFTADSEEGNYQFLAQELRTTEKAAIPAVKTTGDLDSAMKAFEAKFERAGVKHFKGRLAFAEAALDAFKKKKQGGG